MVQSQYSTYKSYPPILLAPFWRNADADNTDDTDNGEKCDDSEDDGSLSSGYESS